MLRVSDIFSHCTNAFPQIAETEMDKIFVFNYHIREYLTAA